MIDSPVISVIVPSIRTENLKVLYSSVCTAFSGKFEFIVVSPYDLPEYFNDKENVVLIKSFRSPLAAQQQGLCISRGELITYASDDGLFLKDALNIAYESLINEPYTTIVTGKYLEGHDPNGNMGEDWYYKLYNHESMQLPGVPQNCYMLNVGLIHRSLLIELGGWDSARFKVCPLGYSDFAIRAYRRGCKFILQQPLMFTCSHEPGMTGTHGPIHIAQTEYDQPMFSGIYSVPSTYLIRQNIPLNNWEKSEEIWSERFKQ